MKPRPLATDRNAERKSLGLSWSEYMIYKAHEWTRLYGVPPGAADWNVGMARHQFSAERLEVLEQRHREHSWPAASTARQHFGSWNTMLTEAGLPMRLAGPHAPLASPVPEPTEQELDVIATMWRDDTGWDDSAKRLQLIAERTGRSPGVVVSYANRIEGLPHRDLSARPDHSVGAKVRRRRERVAELWMEGLSTQAIAEQLGVSSPTVSQDARRLRDMGVDLPKRATGRPTSPDRIEAARLLIRDGWPIERVASTLRLTVATLRELLEQANDRRRRQAVRHARVRVMAHAGLTNEAIAGRLGLLPQEVESMLRESEQDPQEVS